MMRTKENLTYNEVVNWADKEGLNSDTPENWKEARDLMFEAMQKKKPKKSITITFDVIYCELTRQWQTWYGSKLITTGTKKHCINFFNTFAP